MRKIKKVPVILQMEAVECGAASLTMILAYYKKYIPLEKMRIECNVTRDGSSAKYIVKAAMHNGLEAKAYKMDPEQIRQELAATGDDGIQVIARHMNYGLYRVEGKSDCPRDALNICRMLSLKPEILEKIEQAY